MRIDPTTGTATGSIGLTRNGLPYALVNITDIAQGRDGAFLLVADAYGDEICSLDASTGTLTFLYKDSVAAPPPDWVPFPLAYVGLALAPASASPDMLFAYEVDGFDDIFTYRMADGWTRALPFQNFLPSYNAGRGDLAAEPSLPGDIDGDIHVDVVDLLWLVDAFGSVAGGANYNVASDFNADGAVDVVDLLTLVFYFGT